MVWAWQVSGARTRPRGRTPAGLGVGREAKCTEAPVAGGERPRGPRDTHRRMEAWRAAGWR